MIIFWWNPQLRGFNFDGLEDLIFSRTAEFLEKGLLRMNFLCQIMVVKMLCKQSNVVQVTADGYMGLPTLRLLGKLSIPHTHLITVDFHRSRWQFPEKNPFSPDKTKDDSSWLHEQKPCFSSRDPAAPSGLIHFRALGVDFPCVGFM